jgi:hypothetical protein
MIIYYKIIKRIINISLTSFVAICILCANSVQAQTTYYIDSQKGDDNNDGLSKNTAWKSHTMVESANLQPGDTVYFARRSAWTGGLQIDASGSDGNPIIFTNYGSGELPKFSNPNWSDNTGNAIRFNGDYLIADGLYFYNVPPPSSGDFITVWSAGALRLLLGADHCIIRNCYFDTVPKAIQSHGEYTLITHNTMIGEQVLLGSQYWGPIGIQLGIGNQEICYNTIREFWVTEGHAWGQDGGAMEMDDGRNHKDNVYIHHNRTINNCGFLEISWDYDIEHREVWNLRVAFNLSSDYQSIGFLEAPLHDSYIDNNTFDRTRQLQYNSTMEVQLGTPIVRNNLIIFTETNPYRADDGQVHVTPQNNWYYKVDNPGQIYFPESAAGNGDPELVNFVSGEDSDYHLSANSPLIGVAQNLSDYYSTDFEGNPLPDSGAWDVGAIQYQGSVIITSPEVGAVFYVPSEITINADVSGINITVSKVEFFSNSIKIGEDTSSPFSYSWNPERPGTFQLTAVAISDNGAVMNSNAVWGLLTSLGSSDEVVWYSFDVITETGFQPAVAMDETGETPTTLELYMSSSEGSVDKQTLFSKFSQGHFDMFNHVADIWTNGTGPEAYPYAGKSTVGRGSDSGESNTPEPQGVRDLQLHPPETDHLTVAEFLIPFDGRFSISDLAVRRVHNEGNIVTYKVFDNAKNQIASLTASNDRAWVTDEKIYELDSLSAGDRIYFTVDKGENDNYYWDATEIVWTVTFNGKATGLGKQGVNLSKDFTLEQNYPNPFNSSTMIGFDIPKTESVTITLYDIIGQKIGTLLYNKMKAGKHAVKWNGRNNKGLTVPSGIYFYRFESGNRIETRKMMLMR